MELTLCVTVIEILKIIKIALHIAENWKKTPPPKKKQFCPYYTFWVVFLSSHVFI